MLVEKAVIPLEASSQASGSLSHLVLEVAVSRLRPGRFRVKHAALKEPCGVPYRQSVTVRAALPDHTVNAEADVTVDISVQRG